MAEPVVVIGAGPAGMSAAWQLARRGIRVEVIEKEDVVGGLARTTCRREGFCYDYGPHTFHIRETGTSRQVVAEILTVLGDQYDELDRGTRQNGRRVGQVQASARPTKQATAGRYDE